MYTLAQKPNATHQDPTEKSAQLLRRLNFKPGSQTHAAPRPGRTLSNRVEKQSLQKNPEHEEVRSVSRASMGIGFDFAKVPAHSRRACRCGGSCPSCRTNEPMATRELEHDPDQSPGSMIGSHQYEDGEPVPPPELNNGETRCVRETGEMDTQIFNTGCTRPCTEEHERDHRVYRGECCQRYATARQRAIDAGNLEERNRISQRYIDWQNATSDFSECRADAVSRSCGLRLRESQGCNASTTEANRECCTEVAGYISAAEGRARTECPGTDLDCPF